MKQQYSFVTVILLTIVTCGIYGYYFIYKATKDLNDLGGNDGGQMDPSMTILLTVVTCGFYQYYWYYKQGNRMQKLGAANEVKVDENGSSYLIWMILGVIVCGLGIYVAEYMFINNLNKLIEKYNMVQMGGMNQPQM